MAGTGRDFDQQVADPQRGAWKCPRMHTQTEVTRRPRARAHKTPWPQKSSTPQRGGEPGQPAERPVPVCKMGTTLFVLGHFMGDSKESTVSHRNVLAAV